MDRFDSFREWCDNVDGSISEESERRLECALPDDSGEIILDDRDVMVRSDEVRTSGTITREESGPFRHDRVNPPRQKTVTVRDRDYFYGADQPEVDGDSIEFGFGGDSLRISFSDRETYLEERYRDMSREEIDQKMSEIPDDVADEIRDELSDRGLY